MDEKFALNSRWGRYIPLKAKSTSGCKPLTILAIDFPEPQECVQPSVP